MFSVGSIGAIGRGSARSLDALWRLAGFTPSFDFPFARNRSLVNAVTGQSLIAYTQASSGTYVNSDRVITTAASNEPRFDHDPTTGESLGLLPEQQQTNLLLRSEEFGTTWNAVRSSVLANAAIAPNGAMAADKLIEDTSSNTHVISQASGGGVTTSAVSFSIYANSAERSSLFIVFANGTSWVGGGGAGVIFDLSAGTAVTVNSTPTAFSITPLINGWYRCHITGTPSASITPQINIFLRNSSSSNYTGDGISGAYLWGAQLEANLFPTSYTPTGASTVTRSASLADLISSAIANNIRSFYIEFRSPAVGTCGVVSLNDNTANNRAAVITSGTDPRLVVHSGGVEQANINGGTITAGARTRVAVRINNNDFAISINGAAVVTDTSGTLPTVDRIMIGRTQAEEFLNGRIARFTGWNQLLNDATLRSLSSQ